MRFFPYTHFHYSPRTSQETLKVAIKKISCGVLDLKIIFPPRTREKPYSYSKLQPGVHTWFAHIFYKTCLGSVIGDVCFVSMYLY